MLCDGCWVQGDGPHECAGRVERPGVSMRCLCKVYASCGSWESQASRVLRWRRDD